MIKPWLGLASGLFLFCSFLTPQFLMAQEVHGVLKVVKGDVRVKTSQSSEVKKARVGDKVFPKDQIQTGKDSRAKIVMIDTNEINISPDTELIIEGYEFKPEQNKKTALLNVLSGKIRSKVNQKYDGTTNKFEVRTPSAVAGVRGTDFFTSFNRETRATQVLTFEGKVNFGSLGPSGAMINPVEVKVGQTSTSLPNQAPSLPAAVPKAEMAKFDQSTDAEKAPLPSAQKEGRTPAATEEKPKESNKEAPAEKKPESPAKSETTEAKPAPESAATTSGGKPSGGSGADSSKGNSSGGAAAGGSGTPGGNAESSGPAVTGSAPSDKPAAPGSSASGNRQPSSVGPAGSSPNPPGPGTASPSLAPASGGMSNMFKPSVDVVLPPTVMPVLPSQGVNFQPPLVLPQPPPVFKPPPLQDLIQNSGPATVNIKIK